MLTGVVGIFVVGWLDDRFGWDPLFSFFLVTKTQLL